MKWKCEKQRDLLRWGSFQKKTFHYENYCYQILWVTVFELCFLLYRSMLMTASDLSAIAKPWPEQKRVSLTRKPTLPLWVIKTITSVSSLQIANLVAMEFFAQGDKEREEFKIRPIVGCGTKDSIIAKSNTRIERFKCDVCCNTLNHGFLYGVCMFLMVYSNWSHLQLFELTLYEENVPLLRASFLNLYRT